MVIKSAVIIALNAHCELISITLANPLSLEVTRNLVAITLKNNLVQFKSINSLTKLYL